MALPGGREKGHKQFKTAREYKFEKRHGVSMERSLEQRERTKRYLLRGTENYLEKVLREDGAKNEDQLLAEQRQSEYKERKRREYLEKNKDALGTVLVTKEERRQEQQERR